MTVPVCLGEDNLEDNAPKMQFFSFLVNKVTLALSSDALRKGSAIVNMIKSDQCVSRLDSTGLPFDPERQMCALHEALNATRDAVPVKILQP
jgi:hypothetical protein